MRTKQFEIPKEMIALFFDQADEFELETELVEVNEEEELVVDVHYDTNEKEEVMSLVELLEDYYNEAEEEEQEENEV
jgi:hypothetical protein